MQENYRPFYKKKNYWIILTGISVLAAFALCLNTRFANRTEKMWIQSEGQLRLSNITSSVENNLAQAESYAESYAAQLERMIQENDRLTSDEIYDFVYSQNKTLYEKTDGMCFSTYVAYGDDFYIEDFIPDDTFHLSERVWYVGAKKNQGNIYIAAPYIDANTGGMCYTVSMLLNDGETIIGMDFYMDAIQQYIETMNEQIDGISMIVNENGMIVGHNDASYVGQDYTVLQDYKELIEKVFNLYGNYFEYTIKSGNTAKYTVFSDKTTYGWYLIVCLPSASISSDVSTNTLVVNAVLILIWLGSAVIFTFHFKRCMDLKQEVSEREDFIKNISNRLKTPVLEMSRQIQFSDNPDAGFLSDLRDLTDELKKEIGNIASLRGLSGQETKTGKKAGESVKDDRRYKRYSFAIICILLAASVISVAVNTYTQMNFINMHMRNEKEVYYSQVKSWIDENITITNDLALHLGAQPDLYKNYEQAVAYINDVVKDNADISVAYIVNPAWEHTVIMNNGWESEDPDWHVEERDWYVDTILSDSGFNISTPYQDEQTGMYCVTFSQIVYDADGNIVGLVGIDFYMDALIKILGESYTESGYAFLTDPSYIILNHPSEDYQMSMNSFVNGAETEYRDALVSEELTLTRDYNNKYVVALAQREPASGFTVIAVRDVWTMYGTLIVTDFILITVFLVSILAVLAITRYVTRQQEKLNKELQKAADEAIAAGNAKSTFLAQMSHEIRTPINAVLGMNEMILRESAEKNILEYASNAYNAGTALLAIINDVLDISKIEAGKLEIVNAEYDLYSLINDSYHMTVDRANKKGLEFIVDVDENLPSKLYGDMFHIRQIVVNFLTNAIKYSDAGSVELRFRSEQSGEGFILCIDVKDTGIGLTQESIENLFTSFQRFDLKRNQSVEGTGLGLAICKQLAELMGGRLTVESVYGKGSTFTCWVPQKVIDETAVKAFQPGRLVETPIITDLQDFTAPQAHILVVDDVEMNLIVFTNLLKGHELQIDTAKSGKKCLEYVAQKKYDIIFMDHMMPEMDGIETFTNMRRMSTPNQETPVIMLTANAISGEKEKYLKIGFSSYLTKPIQSQKLEHMVIKYLPEEKVVWKNKADKAGMADRQQTVAEKQPHRQQADERFDPSLGMTYTGEEAYTEILNSYIKNGQEKLTRINASFTQENWKDYVIEVHALKSTSLTIGAEPLSRAAKELEQAGKGGDYDTIRAKHAALTEQYRTVLTLGEKYLEEIKADKALAEEAKAVRETMEENLAEVAQDTVSAWVDELLAACEAFDSDMVAEICARAQGHSCGKIALEPLFNGVKQAAEDFEYEEASERAQAIRQSLLS